MTIRIGTLVRRGVSEGRGIVVPCTEPSFRHGISVMVLGEDDGPGSVCTTNPAGFEAGWDVIEPASRIRRVVIMADMEGISAVPNDEAAVTPAEETGGVCTPAYTAACRAMTLDVQMAIAGARAAGAQEIVVADSHWYDTNLSDSDFDVPIVRGSQAALRAMQGADAAMLIGWHAKAGTRKACLPHTYTDRTTQLTIDGREVGEIGMQTRLIASYGVPVVLVTGDYAAHQEVGADVEGVNSATTVVSKFVDEHGAVKHRHASTVWSEIVAGAYRSVRALSTAGRGNLVEHHPGRFEVAVRPGYVVTPDDEAELLESNTYWIKGAGIRESYAAFQRFVDRLPAAGAAPLAR